MAAAKLPAPTRTSFSELFKNVNSYQYAYYVCQKDMDVDEAIAHLAFSYISQSLQRKGGKFKSREFVNLTKLPLVLEDLEFGLSVIKDKSIISIVEKTENDELESKDDEKILVFKEDLAAIENYIGELKKIRRECRESERQITYYIAEKVSNFIIDNELFANSDEKEKIRALSNHPLSFDQLVFLRDLVSDQLDSGKNIIKSDDDNRINGKVNYTLEIQDVENLSEDDKSKVKQNQNGKIKILSIASCAFLSIEQHIKLLEQEN